MLIRLSINYGLNKMNTLKFVIILFLFLLVSISAQNKNDTVTVRDDLKILRISENVYVHISNLDWNDYKVPCNGMICVSDSECVIIDTPVNDDQSKGLIEYVKNILKLNIKAVIPCHWHADCMGGINEFHKNNIPSYSLKLTREIAQEKKLPQPQNTFTDSMKIKFGKDEVIAKYFGGGHTIDNIVVWFPSEKILFGGCLIKAMKWNGLGNLADAVVGEWEETVRKVKASFPEATIVVPGHDEYGGLELLDHTIELVKNHKKQK